MKTLSCILVISLSSILTATGDPLVLGVLEQPQCKTGQVPAVRLLFVKRGKNWTALGQGSSDSDRFNPPLSAWTVALDGHSLGQIGLRAPNPSTPTPEDWFYRRDKLYEPISSAPLPVRANHSKAFGGWCESPLVRPLVIVSEPNFHDPKNWKTFLSRASYKQRLFAPLKRAIGKAGVVHCANLEAPVQSFAFHPADLVIYKAYRSSSGQELVSIGLDQGKYGCDGPMDQEWSNHWFLLDGKSTRFVGREMELIDIGDYDNDGFPEFLFWHSGYNQDGYVLYFDQFKQRTEFLWSYH